MVGEQHALFGQSIDVGRWHHQTMRVDTDVGGSNIVGHDHDNVRTAGRLRHDYGTAQHHHDAQAVVELL